MSGMKTMMARGILLLDQEYKRSETFIEQY